MLVTSSRSSLGSPCNGISVFTRQKRRLCFVMDCSGSMYRFNSLDGRLNRMLEATCLILESMEGHTNFVSWLKPWIPGVHAQCSAP